MQGGIENIAKSVMQSPQGLKIITGLDKFNSILSGEAGRQVLELLGGDAGTSLKNAAAEAAKAPKDQGRIFLSNLLSSKDGTALLGKIIEIMGL